MRHLISQSMMRLFFSAVKMGRLSGLSSVCTRLSRKTTFCSGGVASGAQNPFLLNLLGIPGVTTDLTARLSAVDLVKAAAEALGGKGGGGRPDMAQAGGADVSNADGAIHATEAVIGGVK